MSRSATRGDAVLRTLGTLLKLRDIEHRQAKRRLQDKQVRIAEMNGDIERLKRSRDAVIRRGGGRVLRERLLLDAMTQNEIEKRRVLRRTTSEAQGLLQDYREAKKRRDVISEARDREVQEREARAERAADLVACDAVAGRKAREAGHREEEACDF
jgi:hypothetical protein